MIERTLIIIKPDAVRRQLIGEILGRFEKACLKIIALKMVKPNDQTITQHYTEDIAKRRGAHVRQKLVNDFQGRPVVAGVIEGVGAVEVVRKLVGETEPHKASPGTIRGDYGHYNFTYADTNNVALPNVIHASANPEEAKREIAIWFAPEEILEYSSIHELNHG